MSYFKVGTFLVLRLLNTGLFLPCWYYYISRVQQCVCQMCLLWGKKQSKHAFRTMNIKAGIIIINNDYYLPLIHHQFSQSYTRSVLRQTKRQSCFCFNLNYRIYSSFINKYAFTIYHPIYCVFLLHVQFHQDKL